MPEIGETAKRVDGVSILVGTAACNADCGNCAGKRQRKNAPLNDGELDERRLREVLEHCYERGCRYITLTGSGEPMLSPKSVTRVLRILHEYGKSGRKFAPINIYTNGLKIGFDAGFCERFLPIWRSLGLDWIYVTVHSEDEKRNAEAFRVAKYPDFKVIFERIKKYGFSLRASVVLEKGCVDTCEKFKNLCERFLALGADNVSAWPLKDNYDYISELAPPGVELELMADFAKTHPSRAVRILLGDSARKEMLGLKLALFQNGELSDVWCAAK